MMDSKWIRSELGQSTDITLWRASWAEPDPQCALVHQYFFEAKNIEAAHAKIFAWMCSPTHALPNNARIVQERWCSSNTPRQSLSVWRVAWMENHEKHILFLFEPADQEGAARRARSWARRRNETLEEFQMLNRIDGPQRYQAWFDPEEGRAIFAV